MDTLKEKVVQQYQVLNNKIMNEYYEANMPAHRKPDSTTDSKTIRQFIKDKYVKKLWVKEEDDDPVQLYQSGDLEKKMKKKAKKEQKKKDKKEKKEKKREKEAAKATEKANDMNLLDFQEGDDFGDFQEADQSQAQQPDNGLGDLIGTTDNDNDFGDFTTPEVNNDDGFGAFEEAAPPSAGIDMGIFNTAAPQANTAQNSNLINNLSNLYNQNPTPSDPNNKYAALESLNGPSYPQQHPQPQQTSDMFFGMSMNGGNTNNFGFQQQPQQQNMFNNSGFPSMSHQNSYPAPTSTTFQPQSFPTQSFSSGFGGPAGMTSSVPPSQPPAFSFTSSSSVSNSTTSTTPNSNSGSNDLFGLKKTLEQKNKMFKYNHGSTGSSNSNNNGGAFGSLVSTQWNA